MNIFSSLVAKVEGEGKAMVMGAEKFFDQLEPEIADVAGPYIAKIRTAFTDEMGYLVQNAWSTFKTKAQSAIETLAPKYANDPVGLIGAVFSAVVADLPAILSTTEQLALHGLVTMLVAAL